MINPGDKVKLVDCNLCGNDCAAYDGIYKVTNIKELPIEHIHIYRIAGITNTLCGTVCHLRLRKVYD